VRAVLDQVLGGDGYQVLDEHPDGSRWCRASRRCGCASGRGLLTAERTALTCSVTCPGWPPATRPGWSGGRTGATILTSAKTLPGLRLLQKYAVRCGGGRNHAMGLGTWS